MNRQNLLLLALAGAAGWYIISNQQSLSDTAADVGDDIVSSIVGWKNTNSGPQWVPYINSVELQLGLPADLLARMAYQESSFRPGVIDGTTASPAGALGILQLMPQYFKSVQVPRPFTATDVQNQIIEAGNQVVSLFNQTDDWQLTLAAYNAGLGNVEKYAGIPPFPETQNYVASILADVPSIQGV